ncbi:hypothetical protein CS063_11740 [Sporanaerobium hydrogeniformans]|uniref:Uncharacterized protein n=1 Tax=Sporanaerobium hydrogeniformans TaxID=3072179 RepID=A0AC61DC28_9FIRM|nr:polysaccharide deacetylase family protein [Sporanaerobium hydrogeniformans]PHV70142.1 hypothetical protein CS063_11740 [Sporanaerobium hydrogeniformans]
MHNHLKKISFILSITLCLSVNSTLLANTVSSKMQDSAMPASYLDKEIRFDSDTEELGAGTLLTAQSQLKAVLTQIAQDKVYYFQYKLNGKRLKAAMTAPYTATLEDVELYNGLGRLEIIAYDACDTKIWSKQMDISLKADEPLLRSERLSTSYPLWQKPIYRSHYIPVLLYHVFSEEVKPSQEYIAVDIKHFEEQLARLLDAGYTPISFYDLNQYLERKAGLPAKPFLITADDGYLNNYTLAYPVLQKYNVPATFFLPPASITKNNGLPRFNWEQALEMEQSGLIDIQIHGYDHTPFNKLSLEDVRYQVSRALGVIEQKLGQRDVVVVSYPEFRYLPETQALLSQMKIDFQTTNTGVVGIPFKREDIKRIIVPNYMTPDQLIANIERLTQ